MDFNQDIFTLKAQINHMKDCLLKKEGTSDKLKHVFGSHQELETLKAGITKKIEDMVQQAPLELMNDVNALQDQWKEVQVKLQDEREISDSLQDATRALKDKMRQIYQKRFIDSESNFAFIKDIKSDLRINTADQPHFHKTPQQVAVGIEDKYPDLIEKIFDLALQVDSGFFGEKAKDVNEFSPEVVTDSNSEPWMSFAKVVETWPLTDEERQAAYELFLSNLHELATPTHQKVHLLLRRNRIEQAVSLALEMRSPIEKSKSLAYCVEREASNGFFEQALIFLKEITQKAELLQGYTLAVGKLIEADRIDRAIQIVTDLEDEDLKEHIIKEIAIKLVNLRRIREAIKTTEMIKDPESCSFLQATLVNQLMQMGLLKEATKLARAIKDNGAREDAYGYIVKRLLQSKSIDEALKFASSIKNPTIKTHIAKIIESAMVAKHQNEKVQKVRRLFSLSRPIPNAT